MIARFSSNFTFFGYNFEKYVKIGSKKIQLILQIESIEAVNNLGKILDFDTNYKVYPPLRSKDDIKELFNGLNDGTIDVISSFHQPQDIDSKNCEFDKASFGIISIQTFYSNILEISRHISEDILIEKFTKNPRKILGLEIPKIEEGSFSLLTVDTLLCP